MRGVGQRVAPCPLPIHCGHMPPHYGAGMDKVNTPEAIASIRACAQAGVRVLGLDGFVVAPEGFVAPLDLLLDVSGRGLSAAEAAAQAEAFVRSNASSEVLWEVWTENT